MLLHLLVTMTVCAAAGAGASAAGCEARASGGAVRGARAADGDYCAFLGIPYAAPPTGSNRFKAPQPAAPWAGVLVADASRRCVQPSRADGVEDCLVLSVFTPLPTNSSAPAPEPLPVLVFFHGGGFLFNTATVKGVGQLISQDVIVVSMNYRLGLLGFLCLGTEDAPGNAGLQDQLLALRWVQDNIAAFGGDPAKVTAVGTSAGAASIHLLAASPAADGLFRHAVCMDGTALGDYSISPTPVDNARSFAKILGYDIDDINELTQFYKELPVENFVNKSLEFFNLHNGDVGFGPCVQRPLPGVVALVEQAPGGSLQHNTRPMIFSFSDDEGSRRASNLAPDMVDLNTDFPAFTPSNLIFPNLDIKYAEANKTKAFYFGNKTISVDTAIEYSRFWGDRQFVYPAVLSARAHEQRNHSAHLLEFTYVGNLSYVKASPAAPGASHGDIINYLMPQTDVVNENDGRVVKEITSIVAHFVKTGTARASVDWPPASASADRLQYLRLGSELGAQDEPTPEPMVFWDRLYRLYSSAYPSGP